MRHEWAKGMDTDVKQGWMKQLCSGIMGCIIMGTGMRGEVERLIGGVITYIR